MALQVLMISPAEIRAETGYTLLELLVVIALMALLALSAPTLYARIVPQFQVRQYANEIAYKLRELRREAIDEGEEKSIIYSSGAERVFDIETSFSLAGDVTVVFDPTSPWNTASTETITFYPSGASNGGSFQISKDEISAEVTVDWMSGAVEVSQ